MASGRPCRSGPAQTKSTRANAAGALPPKSYHCHQTNGVRPALLKKFALCLLLRPALFAQQQPFTTITHSARSPNPQSMR